jgi:hypothetical protein
VSRCGTALPGPSQPPPSLCTTGHTSRHPSRLVRTTVFPACQPLRVSEVKLCPNTILVDTCLSPIRGDAGRRPEAEWAPPRRRPYPLLGRAARAGQRAVPRLGPPLAQSNRDLLFTGRPRRRRPTVNNAATSDQGASAVTPCPILPARSEVHSTLQLDSAAVPLHWRRQRHLAGSLVTAMQRLVRAATRLASLNLPSH